jgi:serine/threonine protein kinase/tetratricopeptide (TPR) repeat protein
MQPAEDDLAAGWERIGPYRLGAPLGEGGMGVVYRAEHRDTGDPVAVKVVRVVDEMLIESFRREIFALRSIQHPGIVRVVDDGVWRGQPWYAMPLLAGATFGDLIDELHQPVPTLSDGPPSSRQDPDRTLPSVRPALLDALPRTLALMHSLCAPLAFLHGQGLVHRDLKPDNVILHEGRPVLVDFGLAIRRHEGERRREVLAGGVGVMGTPPYMSPEQIRGQTVDARADLYAFGCVLYECLTGRPPFVGTAIEVLNGHLRDVAVRPSTRVAGLDPALDELVMHLLAKEPEARIGYAEDVASHLAACMKTLAVEPLEPVGPKPRPYLYRSALAGRQPIVAELETTMLRGERPGAMVFIGGQSGVGKTRLATELARVAASRGGVVILGRCEELSSGGARSAPLHPFRSLLRRVADRCQAMGRGEQHRLLGKRWAVLAGYEPALAGLPGKLPPLPELDAEAARFRLFEALAGVMVSLSEHSHVFLLLDDLQWADDLSIAFLHHLDAGVFEAHSVTIVGTYRSDEVGRELAELIKRSDATRLELTALSADAVEAMVAGMLALAEPPRRLVAELVDASEGNPFFVAEYLQVAVEEGLLCRSAAGAWTVAPGGARGLPVPRGLVEVVERRLSALSEPARRLARVAAVLGRDFDGRVLLEAVGIAPDEARGALEELRARRLLDENAQGGLRFAHDKLRETAYAQLNGAELRQLHRRVAEVLEAATRGTPDESLVDAALAHHYHLGGDPDRAANYLERAGEQALRSGASEAAQRHFGRALELATSGKIRVEASRRASWERQLGDASYNLGDLDGARTHLLRSLAGLGVPVPSDRVGGSAVRAVAVVSRQLAGLVHKPSLASGQGRARARDAALAMERLCQVDFFLNRQVGALLDSLEYARLAERLGPSPELARAYGTLEVALGFVPARGLAARVGRRALAIAEHVADPRALGFVSLCRGLHALNEGRHLDARGHLLRALARARDNQDLRTEQEVLGNLGQAYNLAGARDAARRCFRELLASAERTHNRQAMSWGHSGMGSTELLAGRARAAIAEHAQAAVYVDGTADATELLSHGFVAVAHQMVGQDEQALACAEAIMTHTGVPPTAWHCQIGYQSATEVFLAAWERAEREGRATKPLRSAGDAALDVLRSSCRPLPAGRAIAAMFEGKRAHLRGRRRAAEQAFEAAVGEAVHLALPLERGRALYEWGHRLARDDARRGALLRRAVQALEGAGNAYWLKVARASAAAS